MPVLDAINGALSGVQNSLKTLNLGRYTGYIKTIDYGALLAQGRLFASKYPYELASGTLATFGITWSGCRCYRLSSAKKELPELNTYSANLATISDDFDDNDLVVDDTDPANTDGVLADGATARPAYMYNDAAGATNA